MSLEVLSEADLERAEVYGRHLLELGGRARKSELGDLAGLDNTQRSRLVKGMRAHGWIEELNRLEVRLTTAGLARFGGLTHGSAGQLLDEALKGWPAGLRCAVELTICATIARTHLRDGLHLGVVLLGGTGTGKTAAHEQAAKLLGLDPDQTLVSTPTLTSKPLGRREQTGTGWRFEPAPFLGWPLVCFDELDKAPPEVRRGLFPALQGRPRFQVEGEVVPMAATPLATANPAPTGERWAVVDEAVRRRSACLDTGKASDLTDEELHAITAAYTRRPDRVIGLAALTVPGPESTEAARIRAVLSDSRGALTEAGRELFCGPEPLTLAALARLALVDHGPDGAPMAAAHTLAAYLTVAQTVPGLVQETWHQTLENFARDNARHPGAATLRASAAAAARAREQARARGRAVTLARHRAADQVAEAAARLGERLRQARESLDGRKLRGADPDQRTAAVGLRRVLRTLQDSTGQVRTAGSLEELTSRAQDPLDRAARLVAAVARDRQAAQEDRDAERQARELAQRHRAEQERAARQLEHSRRRRAADELAELRERVQPLEQLFTRSRVRDREQPPWRQLQALSFLTYRPEPLSFLERLARLDPGEWVTPDGQTYAGSPDSCPELSTWGPATRRVLAPLLVQLHQHEDRLVDYLGRKPRSSRPLVRVRGTPTLARPNVDVSPASRRRHYRPGPGSS